MSLISYKILKQSPYTPWQYKCSHHEKKCPECEMSLTWYIKKNNKNNLGNQWKFVKSEINRSAVLQYGVCAGIL